MSTRESAAARAGAALASLDNILAGVRDYRKTAVEFRAYKNTLAYVDSFVRRLLVQRTRLYGALVEILEEQFPTTGIDERIERNLKFRLGIFVGPFTDSVVDLLDHIRNHPQLAQIVAFVEEAQRCSLKTDSKTSDDEGQTNPFSWFDRISCVRGVPGEKNLKRAFKERYKPFVFALNDGSLSKTLDYIDQCNHRLEVLAEQALRRRPVARSDLEKWEKVRDYAIAMSRTLRSKSGFTCRCQDPHKTMMRIEDVGNFSSDEDSDDEEQEQTTFQLVFSYRAKELLYWAHTKASILDCEIQAVAESTESKLKACTVEPTEYTKKTVKFVTNVKSVVTFFQRPNPGDLCRFLSSPYRTETSDQVQRYSLSCDQFSVDLCLDHYNNSQLWSGFVSYHDLITGQKRVPLSLEARLRLAAKAASGMLYLHRTVWLDPRWTTLSHYILFVQRKDGTIKSEPCFQQKDRGHGIEIVTPLSKSCEPALYVQHKEHSGQSPSSELETPFANSFEPTLFALGIFLIELSYSETWAEIRTRTIASQESFSNMSPHAMDLAAIDEILRASGNEKRQLRYRPFQKEGPFYLEAIRGCFSGGPVSANSSSYNKNFCEMAYENVVWQLQCALQLYLDTVSSDQEVEDDGSGPLMNPAQSAQFRLFDDHIVQFDSAGIKSDEWFRRLRRDVFPLLPKRATVEPARRVRIAILDSGIDSADLFLGREMGRVKYCSFLGDEFSELPEDAVGHGTHTAALLLTVARNADVFVGRITPDGEQWKSQRLVKAIQWAVDEGVDIISLSFGFPTRTPDLEPVRRAIVDASAKDIMIFAAASNGGGNDGLAFPAREDQVICIGSTDGEGNKSDFTPGPHVYNKFSTVGEAVKSSWPGGENQRKSGTSYATPIAAGIAALVMDFMRQCSEADPHLVMRLKEKRAMEAVLRLMCTERDGFDYIAPWNLFNDLRKDGIATLIQDTLKLI